MTEYKMVDVLVVGTAGYRKTQTACRIAGAIYSINYGFIIIRW